MSAELEIAGRLLEGTQAKIPVWADRSGLGWLMRYIYEPKKFIPRYWSALPLVGMVWAASRQAGAGRCDEKRRRSRR